jgi:predicted transcriptional regulator
MELGDGEMEVSEYLADLGNEQPLARRTAARALSHLAETDPGMFNNEDISTIVRRLREEEDNLTADHLLCLIDYISDIKLNHLVSIGALRALVDVFMKNMGGVGTYVGRDAMRLISLLAAADKEGAEKLDLIGFILRTLASSDDPYIRWFASMGLRKIDPTLIQKKAQEIIGYSINALSNQNEERVKIAGALNLSIIATIAPEAFAGSKVVDALTKSLMADPSLEVQSCCAMALQFIARKDPSQLRNTKIAEVLFKALISKLEDLEKKEERVDREILVTIASTISILALKDASVLAGEKAIEKIDLGEVISKALEKSEGESETRSILISTLVDLSGGKTSEYINNKDLLEVLLRLIESSEEEDANYRSELRLLNKMASTYPSLFSAPSTLEKMASFAVRRENSREEGNVKSKLSPADVFTLLLHSEKGSEILIDNLPKLHDGNPSVFEQLLKVESLKPIQGSLKELGIPAERTDQMKKETRVIVERPKPGKMIAAEANVPITVAPFEKSEPLRSRGLTDQQRSLLQDIFKTEAKITLSELASKLDVNQASITEALTNLINSGKLPYTIQEGTLYLKNIPLETPINILIAEGKLSPNEIKRATTAKCVWCGAQLNLLYATCQTCGKQVARCFICNEVIPSVKELERCPFCGTMFHSDHYKKWAEIRKYCPKCRVPIAP